MGQRTLSSPEAESAISSMASALGEYQSTVDRLTGLGTQLSDPNVWDGGSAIQFRSQIWPDCVKGLQSSVTALTELRAKMDTITKDIVSAGGG